MTKARPKRFDEIAKEAVEKPEEKKGEAKDVESTATSKSDVRFIAASEICVTCERFTGNKCSKHGWPCDQFDRCDSWEEQKDDGEGDEEGTEEKGDEESDSEDK